MNNRELVNKLLAETEGLKIMVRGYEGGYELATTVRIIKVVKEEYHDPYCGEYDENENGEI